MNPWHRRWLFMGTAALALLLAACGKTSDPLVTARRFFELVTSGRTKEAYEESAFAFQTRQTLRAFEATAKELGLVEAAMPTLTTPVVADRSATLDAELATKAGDKLKLIVSLQNENGTWRVFSIKTPPNPETGLAEKPFSLVGKGAGFTDAVSQAVPEEATVRALVRETMGMFNDAIQQGTFDAFYDWVAASWQAQLTKGQLQRAFQPFIDGKVDLSSALAAEPVFDGPAEVNTAGLLVVNGHYATSTIIVNFTHRYIYELPTWKLYGIDANVRGAEAKP